MFFTDYFTFKERGEGWVLLGGRERGTRGQKIGHLGTQMQPEVHELSIWAIPVLLSCLTPLQTRLAGTGSSSLWSQPLCSGQEISRSRARAGPRGSSRLDDDKWLFTASTAPWQTPGLPQSPGAGLSHPRPREKTLLSSFALAANWENAGRERRAPLPCAAPGSSGLPLRPVALPRHAKNNRLTLLNYFVVRSTLCTVPPLPIPAGSFSHPTRNHQKSPYTAPFLLVLWLTLTSVRPLIFKYPQR